MARNKKDKDALNEGFIPDTRQEKPPKKSAKKKTGKITVDDIRKARELLQTYKNGKRNLEQKIINNEQWWKLQHWDFMRSKAEQQQIEPTSAWLFNAIANKHADAMDNYPAPYILPREQSDEATADQLSQIIPAILERCEYEQTYSDAWWYKLKAGTSVKQVFWDNAMGGGLGDVSIRKADILNLFWEAGVTDIQESPNFFHVELRDNDLLQKEYPDIDLGQTPSIDVGTYFFDDTIDTSNKSAVVDWYYKKAIEEVDADGIAYRRTVLHFVKFVNDDILYSSEDDPACAERGFYDHGMYPFVFDVLYPMEGTPAGFGYIDIMKSPQAYIDKLDQAILENALVSSRKRFFVRRDSSVDEEEFLDLTKPLVHTDGNLGDDSIREMNYRPLSNIYYNVKLGKIDELKETAGNRDFSQGSVANGVTAASAIQALMEAGSKLSRDMLKASYRAFTKECYMVIELIRQFYDLPRVFRISGESTAYSFVTFDNSMMQPQAQGMDFGVDLGSRLPVFDIKVSAEKQATVTRLSQNELALQLYGQGFFVPTNATPALACLQMMDFEGKKEVVSMIEQGQTLQAQIQMLQDQLMKLAAVVDAQNGSSVAQNLGAAIQQEAPQQAGTPQKIDSGVSSRVQKAKEAARSQAAVK